MAAAKSPDGERDIVPSGELDVLVIGGGTPPDMQRETSGGSTKRVASAVGEGWVMIQYVPEVLAKTAPTTLQPAQQTRASQ
jgi:hypothetical protein